VFNGQWRRVLLAAGAFRDPNIPTNYHPFNILFHNNELIVTFAIYNGAAARPQIPQAGAGNGFVSVFDLNGRFLRRVATQGRLDSPWALAVAPVRLEALRFEQNWVVLTRCCTGGLRTVLELPDHRQPRRRGSDQRRAAGWQPGH
jgi:uncharacterized protein (TIGR03118 family)